MAAWVDVSLEGSASAAIGRSGHTGRPRRLFTEFCRREAVAYWLWLRLRRWWGRLLNCGSCRWLCARCAARWVLCWALTRRRGRWRGAWRPTGWILRLSNLLRRPPARFGHTFGKAAVHCGLRICRRSIRIATARKQLARFGAAYIFAFDVLSLNLTLAYTASQRKRCHTNDKSSSLHHDEYTL